MHVKSIDVVELTVPCLGYDRQRPPIATEIGSTLFDTPADDGIARDANTMRVRQYDWSFELAGLVDPCRARHFPIAIQREPAAEHGGTKTGSTARQDCRDAGAHLLSARQIFYQGDLPNGYTCDVS